MVVDLSANLIKHYGLLKMVQQVVANVNDPFGWEGLHSTVNIANKYSFNKLGSVV